MSTAGEIAVKLGLNSEDFIKGLEKAEKELKDLEKNLDTSKDQFEYMQKAMAMTEKPTEEMQNAFKALKEELTKNQNAFDTFNKNLDTVHKSLEKAPTPIDTAIEKFDELETNLKKSKEDFERYAKAMAMTEKPTEDMEKELKRLKDELDKNQKAFDKARDKAKQMGASFQKVNPIVEQLKNKLLALTKIGLVVQLTKKLIEAGKEAVNTAAKFETLGVSFEVLAGGVEAGKKLTNQIVELASKTPLTTEALSDGAKTLLSFGESANNVIDDLKLLGDISGGDTQRMQSLTLAFAQIGSTGRLAGQDLLQMINAGFNPLEQMSKKTGKSIGQLKDEMSKGLITFKDVKQAMIEATSEGGRFYGMMNKQSDTLDGRLSTLSDTWQLIKKNIGDFFLPAAKAAVSALNAMAQSVLNLMNKIHDLGVELRGNTVQGQLKKAAGLEKEAKKYNDLAAKELERANALRAKGQETRAKVVEERANAYLNHSKKFAEAATRAKAASEALKAADNNTNNLDSGFDALSTTGAGDDKGKSKQDKALEAYKKYIEEYAKLNDDYAATLKARQYVEGTLNIDPIKQAEQYDKMVTLYQAHLSKMAEIRRSGTKNQAEIEKLEEAKLAQDLQTLRLDKERETQTKLAELVRGYNETAASIDTSEIGYVNSFLGGLSSEYKARLDLEKWYQGERKKIIEESNGDIQLQQEAFSRLSVAKEAKLTETNLATWASFGQSITSTVSNTFSSLLSGQESFSDAMRNMASNMLNQMLQMLINYVIREMAIRTLSFFLGGAVGGAGGAITSGGSSLLSGGGKALASVNPSIGPIARMDYTEMLPKYHSGGLVPGTKEQIAVLKGGERVLNPAESSSYANDEGAEGNINNIMVFNIKAWDGKDVINTLKANEQTINQIVSSGIKNNKQGLRTIVQNT